MTGYPTFEDRMKESARLQRPTACLLCPAVFPPGTSLLDGLCDLCRLEVWFRKE
jgi:hypothetical protein